MYLQFCAGKGVMRLSILGMIKLSYRQAEGRRATTAVLCLKYIVLLALAASVGFICLRTDDTRETALLIACLVAAAVFAVAVRGMIQREAYTISSEFLRCESDGRLFTPDLPELLGAELAYLAALRTVNVVMLSPSYICLRAGITYYSLSADRRGFMLLLGAAILLAAAGAIFSAVICTRLCAAEYLWISGQCDNMLLALDTSWELTRNSWGCLLRLRAFSPFCGAWASLVRMNASSALLSREGLPGSHALCIELMSDDRGEQHIQLITESS